MMQTTEIIQITQTLKLLYVEDDKDARETTLAMLENFFHDITVGIDGEDGFCKYESGKFDIILSDINMPKMNGIEMVKKIRSQNRDISILFLSAYNETNFLAEGIKLGVDGYILKPLNLNNFIGLLTKICEKMLYHREQKEYQKRLELAVKKQTHELNHKLHFDDLTGLHNRYSFFEDIKSIETPIVFIVDIKKFKIINEIYGTNVGSIVLKEFAKFLLAFTKGTQYKVYRLSGDEFILRDETDIIDPEKYESDIARFFNLLHNFRIEIEDDSISIEVTMGLSTSQNDAFESAKIALEFAKAHQRPYEMYSTAIDKRSEEQDAIVWKNRTKEALSNHRVVPVYQAIVNQYGETVKYETLMRIKDEKNDKLISPFYFLDIAIKTGLYSALSSHIIFEALHLLDATDITLSINFTYGDIKDETLLSEIESFFRASPELGQRAVFEITENENIASYAIVKKFIKRFRAYNVQFAIDDFGSGFSNFEYILEIEPDYLKIDGSLIKNIDTDKKALILVSAIVKFSHQLGIKVIAEYVHSKLIFKMLQELEVDEYQGFYFAEPLEEI